MYSADDMIEREENHEQMVKNLRLDYEDQMNVLRAQIGHLTAEVREFYVNHFIFCFWPELFFSISIVNPLSNVYR
jgi:hypothetical protein